MSKPLLRLGLIAMFFIFSVKDVYAGKQLQGDEILALAREAAGGDGWANAKTLSLSGTAIFYSSDGPAPRSEATSYRMWREFDTNRQAAHGPEGKVRIVAKNGEKLIFEVGYNGEITWTESGIIPKAEADKYWASNFGFGIIRQAGKPGFIATRLPDDAIGIHRLYMVEMTDPKGSKTLFGIDQKSHAIRTLGFRTPKGWHLRTYDDFVELKNPKWRQARHVTLYYDGRKSNEVFWTETKVDKPMDGNIFKVPEFKAD